MKLTDREIDLSQFTLVLTAEQISGRMIELCGLMVEEQYALPWWRWIARRRASRCADVAFRLADLFSEYAKSQDQVEAQ